MEESVRLEDIEVDVRIESECILNWIVGRGMDSSGSRQRLSEGCYEHADELTDTMTWWNIFTLFTLNQIFHLWHQQKHLWYVQIQS